VYEAFDQDELDRAEDYFIRELGTMEPDGYNARGGGRGIGFSEPAKERHKAATVAAMNTPEMRDKMSRIALAQFADPKKRSRHKKAHNAPGFIEKMRAINEAAAPVKSKLMSESRWATDGARNRRLKPGEMLPDGWSYGRAKSEALLRSISTARRASNRRNAGMVWITDGVSNSMIASDATLPDGWRCGMTKSPRGTFCRAAV
jgi:hypothetical protein